VSEPGAGIAWHGRPGPPQPDADALARVAELAPAYAVTAVENVTNLLSWLPNATYPIRSGAHFNGAFGLRLALPWAQRRAAAGDGALLAEILRAAERWFLADRDYPAAWEPSGADFLSPALCEAELMVDIAGPDWLAGFLPTFPETLLQPVTVTDDSDGQLAHLHGLNLSRAWAWRRLAAALPAGDPRGPVARSAAHRHAEAGMPYATGGDYMVEHWLAAYALLQLTG
jgi:Protein of unknown function (DUF2891)